MYGQIGNIKYRIHDEIILDREENVNIMNRNDFYLWKNICRS